MTQILSIAAGGAVGALLRFWLSSGIYSWLGRAFPWGTLAVNVIGSLAMGFLYILLIERMALSAEWRSLLLVGLLGAFTTFSTFSIETMNLIESGEIFRALLNILASVIGCLLACWLGMFLARQF